MLPFLLLCFVINSFQLQGNPQACPTITDCRASFAALHYIAYAVDLPTLNLFPSSGQQPTPPPKPILNLTCDDETSWQSDFGCSVPFPDQVTLVRFKKSPTGDETDQLLGPAFVEEVKGLGGYRDQLEESTGVGDINLGVMSLTEHYRDWQRWLLKEDKTIVYCDLHDYRFQVILKSPVDLLPSISNTFILSTQTLRNQTFVDAPKPFEKLLKTFGTHYFTRVSFGHEYQVRCIASDSYALTLSGEELKAIAGACLNMTRKIKLEPEIKKLYETAQKAGVQCGLKVWGRRSIWMISGEQLEPISALIEDDAVGEQVDLAIQSRLRKSALSEWKLSLQLIAGNAPKSWILFPPAVAISKLIGELDGALKETQLEDSRFEKLKDKATATISFAIYMKGNNPHSV